jgi:hypothetical protein
MAFSVGFSFWSFNYSLDSTNKCNGFRKMLQKTDAVVIEPMGSITTASVAQNFILSLGCNTQEKDGTFNVESKIQN